MSDLVELKERLTKRHDLIEAWDHLNTFPCPDNVRAFGSPFSYALADMDQSINLTLTPEQASFDVPPHRELPYRGGA